MWSIGTSSRMISRSFPDVHITLCCGTLCPTSNRSTDSWDVCDYLCLHRSLVLETCFTIKTHVVTSSGSVMNSDIGVILFFSRNYVLTRDRLPGVTTGIPFPCYTYSKPPVFRSVENDNFKRLIVAVVLVFVVSHVFKSLEVSLFWISRVTVTIFELVSWESVYVYGRKINQFAKHDQLVIGVELLDWFSNH